MIDRIKKKILEGHLIDKESALALSRFPTDVLCRAADEIRAHFCKDSFDICTIINAKSGKCSEDCKYCSQSSSYKCACLEYPLLGESEILKEAFYNEGKGILRYSIVTSGKRLSAAEINLLCEVYKKLTEKTSLSLCASHGLLEYEDFVKLEKAGVKRYHNNLETSRRNFPNICTTHSYDDKIRTIKAAQKAGLSVCSGGIMGLGENTEDRIDMALDLRSLSIKSIPLNFLNPIKGTPFENMPQIPQEEARQISALFRFILPDAAIRLAGGRRLMTDFGRSVFAGGANAAISGDMLTTTGTGIDSDIKMIKELGFEVRKI